MNEYIEIYTWTSFTHIFQYTSQIYKKKKPNIYCIWCGERWTLLTSEKYEDG